MWLFRLRSRRKGCSHAIVLAQLLLAMNLKWFFRSPRKTAGMRRKHSVLIVDDDDTLRSTLEKIFVKAGYQARTAKNGQEALKVFAEDEPDLVLADVRMPRKNGLSLLDEIASRKPDCKVIIMTAYGDQDSPSDALRRGAFAYLDKPVSRGELLALCAKALEGS
jgi:DNA-binding NtrC family response regulator